LRGRHERLADQSQLADQRREQAGSPLRAVYSITRTIVSLNL
jgi:hypothetical protein